MKPVYKDHPRDFLGMWSLHTDMVLIDQVQEHWTYMPRTCRIQSLSAGSLLYTSGLWSRFNCTLLLWVRTAAIATETKCSTKSSWYQVENVQSKYEINPMQPRGIAHVCV